jgi:hypothetical protein
MAEWARSARDSLKQNSQLTKSEVMALDDPKNHFQWHAYDLGFGNFDYSITWLANGKKVVAIGSGLVETVKSAKISRYQL